MDTLNKSCLSHFCIPVTKTLLYTTLSLDAEETWVGPVLCGHVLIWNLWILLLKEKHQAKVRNLLKVSASLYSSFYVCNCQSLFRELTSYWMELIMQILGKSTVLWSQSRDGSSFSVDLYLKDTFPYPPDASSHQMLWFLFHKYFLSLLIITMSFLSPHHLLPRNSLQIGLLWLAVKSPFEPFSTLPQECYF